MPGSDESTRDAFIAGPNDPILITGAAGFIGLGCCKICLIEDFKICVVSSDRRAISLLSKRSPLAAAIKVACS